jgi:putative endonuclease
MTTPDRMTARPPAPKRIAAYRAGLSAEAEAAACLTSKGFTILAQRHRTRYGEIDLIAQAGTLIVFVEVKARARLDDAAYAITLRQQKRIITAAQAWLAAHPAQAGCELRFDAVLVAPHAPPLHLAAAFDASP